MIEKLGGEVSRGILLLAGGIYIILPLILGLILFPIFIRFLSRFSKESIKKEKFSLLFLWITILIYCSIFGTMSVLKYLSFHTTFFDLGIYDYAIWNIAKSGDLSYLFWGHFRPIVGVYAFFYKLFPSAITLLLLQTLAIGISAVPLYYIAREKLRSSYCALLIVVIYFLYSPVEYNNLVNFHADHLIILLMFLGFYFLEKKNVIAFLLVCLPGLFLKEPLILSVSMMGFYALVRYRMYKSGALLFIGSLLFFFLVINVIMPGLGGAYYRGGVKGSFSYLGNSVFEIIKTWVISQDIKSTENIGTNTAGSTKTDVLPYIYYIIFDRYASADTLKEVYNFDNSEFINYLSDRGFYVASKSRSNYAATAQSLAASLNMEYVNYLSDKVGKKSRNRMPIYRMLQDYKVWRFLKAKGYKFIHLGSLWYPTSRNKYADINYDLPFRTGFSLLLYKTTIFYPVDNALGVTKFGSARLGKWKDVPYKFDKLAEIPAIKEPVFVFAHFLLPHSPFIFDRNGNFLSRQEARKRSKVENYVDQLIFTNKKIKVLIEKLLSKSQSPPIIILQADEGPYPQRYWDDKDNFDWKQATGAELREKMRILNAYYLPNVDKSLLYPSITPVNSFRLIFNLYFDTHFELLPDKTYSFVDKSHIYNLFEVTDKVKYD